MARFNDVSGSQQGWIHELARAELQSEAASLLLQAATTMDPQQQVEESTIAFLTSLRERFTEYVKTFNVYSESGTRFQEIKIYNLANTAADFMIFRNQIKLVIANTAHGVIQLSFAHHARNAVGVNGQPGTSAESGMQELLAQVGPFRDVHWTFQSEKITPEQVAKFYFSEFTRMTREVKRSKAGNQLLLDQIKALLQEKGLEL